MFGIFLDIETNGLDFFLHYPLEIAYQIIDLQSKKILDSYEALIDQPDEVWSASNPRSLAINGWTYPLLKKGSSMDCIGNAIEKRFQKNGISRKNALFICQNPSFDRVFFAKIISPERQEKARFPYHWLDLASMYFALKMQKSTAKDLSLPLSKNEIANAFSLEKEEHPHRAKNGVLHLISCYEKVIGFSSD